MKSFNDFDPNQNLFLLLVGSPGTGKTTLALQFPRPYIFDADGNLSGPVRHLKGLQFKYDSGTSDDDGKEVPPFQRWNHMSKCLNAAVQDPEIDTIILDSLSAITEYAKDDIKRQRGANPMAKNAPLVTESNRGMMPLIMQEWDVFAHYLSNLVTQLKACGKTVIFTGHNELQTDDSNTTREVLCIQGRMRGQFSGMFGDVWQTFIKTTGVGETAKSERMIRVIPLNGLDMKGVKTSLDFPNIFPSDFGFIKSKLGWK